MFCRNQFKGIILPNYLSTVFNIRNKHCSFSSQSINFNQNLGKRFNATRRVVMAKCCGKQKCNTKKDEFFHGPKQGTKTLLIGKY